MGEEERLARRLLARDLRQLREEPVTALPTDGVTGDTGGVVDEQSDHPGFVDVGLPERVGEFSLTPNLFGQCAQP
jgi:hypothetical protein